MNILSKSGNSLFSVVMQAIAGGIDVIISYFYEQWFV